VYEEGRWREWRGVRGEGEDGREELKRRIREGKDIEERGNSKIEAKYTL
jgi:hypothetical protein